MNIDELIKELEKVREEHGNLEVVDADCENIGIVKGYSLAGSLEIDAVMLRTAKLEQESLDNPIKFYDF